MTRMIQEKDYITKNQLLYGIKAKIKEMKENPKKFKFKVSMKSWVNSQNNIVSSKIGGGLEVMPVSQSIKLRM